MDGISSDVAQFTRGCEHLLSALASHTEFSEMEQRLINYYCHEVIQKAVPVLGALTQGQ